MVNAGKYSIHGAYAVWIDQTTATLKIAGIAGCKHSVDSDCDLPKDTKC